MISGISGTETTTSSTSSSAITDSMQNGKLGKDQFLELLVAEMKHQDPLDPKQDKEFIAELAQFSSLEQAENTNKNMEKMLANQSISNNFGFINFIGKKVEYSFTDKDPATGEEFQNVAQGTVSQINIEGDPKFYVDGKEIDMSNIKTIIN